MPAQTAEITAPHVNWDDSSADRPFTLCAGSDRYRVRLNGSGNVAVGPWAPRGTPAAQAAGDWGMAARLLADHWLDLYLGGRGATVVELLGQFPRRVVAASAELTAVQVAADLVGGSLADAGRHLAAATSALAAVPADRRGRAQVMLAVLRLLLARRLLDFPVVAEEAQRLLALTEGADAGQAGRGEDVRAVAFISLGIAEIWALRLQDADRHLNQGVALARRAGRPYLEFTGLAHGAHGMVLFRPGASQAERSRQAIELADRHGWAEEPLAGVVYTQLAIMRLHQGQPDEAEPWLQRAERTLRTGAEPAVGMSLRHARGVLELVRGRPQQALAAFQDAEKLAAALARPHGWLTSLAVANARLAASLERARLARDLHDSVSQARPHRPGDALRLRHLSRLALPGSLARGLPRSSTGGSYGDGALAYRWGSRFGRPVPHAPGRHAWHVCLEQPRRTLERPARPAAGGPGLAVAGTAPGAWHGLAAAVGHIP